MIHPRATLEALSAGRALRRACRAVGGGTVTREEWRPIPGHDAYEASSLGRVRSARCILKPWVSNDLGHLKVGLGHRRREWVHRIVALAFHGPCPEGLEVRHLDGVPDNNCPDNLCYGTHSENMQDRTRHAHVPLRHGTHCPRGHAYGTDRVCWECQRVAKKRWVQKNVGVYLECDGCGKTVSKLNLRAHQLRARCKSVEAA